MIWQLASFLQYRFYCGDHSEVQLVNLWISLVEVASGVLLGRHKELDFDLAWRKIVLGSSVTLACLLTMTKELLNFSQSDKNMVKRILFLARVFFCRYAPVLNTSTSSRHRFLLYKVHGCHLRWTMCYSRIVAVFSHLGKLCPFEISLQHGPAVTHLTHLSHVSKEPGQMNALSSHFLCLVLPVYII